MLVLGIESSCDETGVALVEVPKATPCPGCSPTHCTARSRCTRRTAAWCLSWRAATISGACCRCCVACCGDAGRDLAGVDASAYTRGPGLGGALLVGAGVACALAAALGRPALGVHHLEGHLLSPFLSADPPSFPFVALLVSGGHTQLMRVRAVGDYELLGETVDDAAGEAFDKSAKLLGLGYPGGPALAALALLGDAAAFKLPRPLLHSGNLDFSFAGLKTAVLTQSRKLGADLPARRADLAAATEAAIVDVLVAKSRQALDATGCDRLVVAGGVGANMRLRERLDEACRARQARVHYPELAFCTDNGAMIALAAAMRLAAGAEPARQDFAFDVKPRWPLAELTG